MAEGSVCKNDIKYTYLQENTSKKSLIDHIFVSNYFHNNVIKYQVVDKFVN